MVQQNMGFDAALGAAELGPREQGQAQRDGGGIQRQQFVLEPELMLAAAHSRLSPEPRQRGPEQILEQRCGAVFVGVGQGATAGRLGNPQVHQASQATGQAITDLAQGVGASELAEQHGHELRPAGKALGGTLGIVLLDECGELGAREMLEQLIEQARNLYDCLALLVGNVWRGFWQEMTRQRPIIGGHFPLFQSPACCFGQE
jgi:hypothetical protein